MILFKGLVAPCDVPTGDGRMFAAGKLTHRPTPIPMMAKFETGGHDGGVPVAVITNFFVGPGGYWAEGYFLDPNEVPEVSKAVYMVQKKVLGPSVDLDRDFTVKVVPHPTRPDKKATLFEEYNVIGITLVPMPAFYQVHMSIGNSEEKSLLASAGVDVSQFLDKDSYEQAAGTDLWSSGGQQFDMAGIISEVGEVLPVTASPIPGPPSMVVVNMIQNLLAKLLRLGLDAKQAHWNVIGPDFIAVHKMLDKIAAAAYGYADGVAERIATLGGSPDGTVKGIVTQLGVEQEYPSPYGRANTQVYLRYINHCLTDVIQRERQLIEATGPLDVVTQNLLLGQAEELEKWQWFVRAHLERTITGDMNRY